MRRLFRPGSTLGLLRHLLGDPLPLHLHASPPTVPRLDVYQPRASDALCYGLVVTVLVNAILSRRQSDGHLPVCDFSLWRLVRSLRDRRLCLALPSSRCPVASMLSDLSDKPPNRET